MFEDRAKLHMEDLRIERQDFTWLDVVFTRGCVVTPVMTQCIFSCSKCQVPLIYPDVMEGLEITTKNGSHLKTSWESTFHWLSVPSVITNYLPTTDNLIGGQSKGKAKYIYDLKSSTDLLLSMAAEDGSGSSKNLEDYNETGRNHGLVGDVLILSSDEEDNDSDCVITNFKPPLV